MTTYVEAVKQIVEKTILDLSRRKLRPDPLGGPRYSRMTSIINSAYKRHGQIGECALIERLKESNPLQVWNEKKVLMSPIALHPPTMTLSAENKWLTY
jgi:hypothetical protein